VTEPAARKMVVGSFNDDSWSDWFPFARAICTPTTRPPGPATGESRWFLQRFKFLCQRPTFRCFERRGKSHVMQQTIFSVKPEQKRTNQACAPRITESANNAISRADLLYLNRCSAFTRSVRSVESFRDDSIKVAADFFKPPAGSPVISCRRRKAQSFSRSEI